MITAAQIVSAADDFWTVQSCTKIFDVIGDARTLVDQYPSCSSLANDGNLKALAAVSSNFGGSAAELMSAMNISFGMAGWLATSLHAIGVEVYVSRPHGVSIVYAWHMLMLEQLQLTPIESERLRQVSYQRQMEAGFKNTGHAGLIAHHSSVEASAYTPVVTERKPSAMPGDFSEGETLSGNLPKGEKA
jgi:hypothetical protein